MTKNKYNSKEVKYIIKITIEGYPAEIIDELVESGLYGNNRAGVLRNLAFSRMEEILKEDLLGFLRKQPKKRKV